MTIRTAAGPIVIDAGDFQFTHAGVTLGLKLTYSDTPVGRISSLYLAEKVGSEWKTDKEYEMALEFDGELRALGVTRWITEKLLPKLNAWLAKRFASGPVTPDPVPDWVPQIMVDLDAALRTLQVAVVSGVPKVSQGGASTQGGGGPGEEGS